MKISLVQMAYTTILEAIKCNLAVIREERRISANIIKQAKKQACELRNYLGWVIPDNKATARPDWGKLLSEMNIINPCN